MHYYQHHIGDYQRDTKALSILQHGAYRMLMDEYYVTERPLPVDPDALYRICHVMTKAERVAVCYVAERFFTICADGLRHKRIDSEISDYHSRLETASRAGKASATARQRKGNARSTPVQRPLDSSTNGTSTDPPTEVQRNVNGTSTNHEPVTNNQVIPLSPRPTLSQAKGAAGTAGVSEQEAEEWWDAREASEWMKGTGGGGTTPVGQNWQSDMKSFTNRARERKAGEAAKLAARTNGANGSSKPQAESIWQLKQSLDAVNDAIRDVDSRAVGAWGELSKSDKAKRADLVQRRHELREKLTGLEATA